MANTRTQAEVEAKLRPFGFTGPATGGRAKAFVDARPELQQMMREFTSVAPLSQRNVDQSGVVPITAEPLHQFEREGLKNIGQMTPERGRAFVSDEARQSLDRFGRFQDEAASAVRQGMRGFDQGEFNQYMNPYTEQVTERAVDQLSSDAQEMRNKLLRAQASNRPNASFGDLYGAQRMADIDEQLVETTGNLRAQMGERGFNQSLDRLFQQRNNQLGGGQILGGLGRDALSGANVAQGLESSGLRNFLSMENQRIGAGGMIRDYNQNLANAAFDRFSAPQQFQNQLTQNALNSYRGLQRQTPVPYNTPQFDRFGNTMGALGAGLNAVRGAFNL